MDEPVEQKYREAFRRGRPKHEGCDDFSLRHPKMPLGQRAKIFAPFAALRGFEESVEEKNVVRIPRRILSEEEQEALGRRLQALFVQYRSRRARREAPVTVTVRFFLPDGAPPEGEPPCGQYRTLTGPLLRFDPEGRCLSVDGVRVPLDAIDALSCEALPAAGPAELSDAADPDDFFGFSDCRDFSD